MRSKAFNILLIVALALVAMFSIDQCQRANLAERDARILWEDQKELTVQYRDEKGRLTNEVAQAALSNEKLLKDMAEKDLDIKRLKGE